MRIHKGDTIKIISGRDRNKTGKVMNVDVKNNLVLVEGLNVFKRHIRPKRQGEKGQIVSLPRPMHTSKIMLVCPSCSKGSRVGYRLEGEKKSRYCKKCKSLI